MKPKRKIATIELLTSETNKDLKDWFETEVEKEGTEVVQVQINTVKEEKK